MNNLTDSDDDRDQYLGKPLGLAFDQQLLKTTGLPLRELIYEYKHQTLVLFKCCLLQPKVNVLRQQSHQVLTAVDAVFWVSMRETLHDAIFLDILDTWAVAKLGRLCRS